MRKISMSDLGIRKFLSNVRFQPKADIPLESANRAANDPKRNSKLLGHLFYGMSLVYANGAKQQIAVTGEK